MVSSSCFGGWGAGTGAGGGFTIGFITGLIGGVTIILGTFISLEESSMT